MYYPIKIQKLADHEFLATCRDIPECLYKGESLEQVQEFAGEALPGALELFYRRKRKAFPLPTAAQPGEIPVFVPLKVQAKIMFWNFLSTNGIKASEAARRLGVTQTQVQRMVDLSQDKASLESIEEALEVFGARFTLTLEKEP